MENKEDIKPTNPSIAESNRNLLQLEGELQAIRLELSTQLENSMLGAFREIADSRLEKFYLHERSCYQGYLVEMERALAAYDVEFNTKMMELRDRETIEARQKKLLELIANKRMMLDRHESELATLIAEVDGSVRQLSLRHTDVKNEVLAKNAQIVQEIVRLRTDPLHLRLNEKIPILSWFLLVAFYSLVGFPIFLAIFLLFN